MTIGNRQYEWIEAAHWDNMSYKKFRQKPVHYQESILGAYRAKLRSEAVLARDMQRKGGKRPPRMGGKRTA